MKRLATVFGLLSIVALAGCADAKGDPCNRDKQCGGGNLICAARAACGGEDCEGYCEKSCGSNEDCGKNEQCVFSANDRKYCDNDDS